MMSMGLTEVLGIIKIILKNVEVIHLSTINVEFLIKKPLIMYIGSITKQKVGAVSIKIMYYLFF